jgi:hypothetical protein
VQPHIKGPLNSVPFTQHMSGFSQKIMKHTKRQKAQLEEMGSDIAEML